jgi:hypothetical protein
MAQIQKFLSIYETSVLISKKNFSGIAVENFGLKNGSRLVITLTITAIDAGAQVNVDILNGFSLDVPFQNILSFSKNSVGSVNRVLTDIHSLFQVVVSVIGGSASFAIGITITDNAIGTRIDNAIVDVNVSHLNDVNGQYDSIRIGDGVNLLQVNNDGSLNVNVIQSSNDNEKINLYYNEISNLPALIEQTLITYIKPVTINKSYVQKVSASGGNIAEYKLYLNSNLIYKKRTAFGSSLNCEFSFDTASESGLLVNSSDVLELKVIHNRSQPANFNATMQVLEIV